MDYLGEAVNVATHMLQAGALAQAAGAPDALVAAALLHDVGHLVAAQSAEVDARHEESGASWLAELGFSPEVSEPVRLHVAAKRYLCAVDPSYVEALSPASKRSLELQGGAMSAEGAASFAQLDYAADAVAVRRWDEAAKDPGAGAPPFDAFRALLERTVRCTSVNVPAAATVDLGVDRRGDSVR